MTYTPGPWKAYRADYRQGHDELLPVFVVGPMEFHSVAQVRPGCTDDDLPAQTEANAHLIAAAPDLLIALKAFVAPHHDVSDSALQRRVLRSNHAGHVDEAHRILVARAAIASAESGVPSQSVTKIVPGKPAERG